MARRVVADRLAAELVISLTVPSAYQGPVSMFSPVCIPRRQSAYHPADRPIVCVGHLSGCPLFHPPKPRSRVKRKAERPRPRRTCARGNWRSQDAQSQEMIVKSQTPRPASSTPLTEWGAFGRRRHYQRSWRGTDGSGLPPDGPASNRRSSRASQGSRPRSSRSRS